MLLRIVDRLRAARESDEGFSIIEVMVAMTVFAMIAAGVAAGIASTLYLTQDNRSREAALNLANQALDAARSTKDVFTLDDDTSTLSVGNQDYTVKQTTNWINSDGSDNSCGAGSGVLAYKRVSINVSWTSGTSPRQKSVVLDTLISPSSAVSSATASTIVVGVRTATGGPNSGVAVTITPVSGGATSLSNPPAATDSNGCSYAVGVTPGTYKVTITKAGNIDKAGATAPYASIATVAGGVGNAAFLYDQGVTVTAGAPLNLKDGVAVKLPTLLPMTYRYDDTVQTVTTTSTVLFPYQWTAIAGAYPGCTDVDPTAWPAANNLATSPNIFNAMDGSTPGYNPTTAVTATARAPMGVIDVKMGGLDTVLVATSKNASPVPNGDPGCSTATTYTFTGMTSAAATTIALPFGTWTLRGTTILGGVLSSNSQSVASNSNVTNLKVSTSGNVVTLDPRTVPTS